MIAEDFQAMRLNDPVGIEVDQTGMELHERCTRKVCNEGLWAPWLNLFSRIKGRVMRCEQYDTVIMYVMRALKFDFQGTSMKVTVETDGVRRLIDISFLDLYMTSGWRLTSTINFLVEKVATLCCLTLSTA